MCREESTLLCTSAEPNVLQRQGRKEQRVKGKGRGSVFGVDRTTREHEVFCGLYDNLALRISCMGLQAPRHMGGDLIARNRDIIRIEKFRRCALVPYEWRSACEVSRRRIASARRVLIQNKIAFVRLDAGTTSTRLQETSNNIGTRD